MAGNKCARKGGRTDDDDETKRNNVRADVRHENVQRSSHQTVSLPV